MNHPLDEYACRYEVGKRSAHGKHLAFVTSLCVFRFRSLEPDPASLSPMTPECRTLPGAAVNPKPCCAGASRHAQPQCRSPLVLLAEG